MAERITTAKRTQLSSGQAALASVDQLVVEEPLEIRLNGEALSVTMRTPGDDFALVRGFLFTEGIVSGGQDIQAIQYVNENPVNQGNIVSVAVPSKILEGKCWRRNFYASSSCGVCGKASIEQLQIKRPKIESQFMIKIEKLYLVPNQMREAQAVFEETGGLHAAALFDSKGKILCVCEDVGRHNAVDKVIGWAMENMTLPLKDMGLFVSGRTSFEIMQKAISAGIPLVGAVSAPSSLAVQLANEYGVTLAGFVRERSLSIYAGEERILGHA